MKKNSIALLLVLSLIVVGIPAASAAVPGGGDVAQPYASEYLSSYGGCTYNGDDGRIYVDFHVFGTGTMDVIGATKVLIQENYESGDESGWITVGYFDSETTPSLLTTNNYLYGSTVSCPRVAGKQYRGKITVYAEKDGKGNSRVYTTAYVVANPHP